MTFSYMYCLSLHTLNRYEREMVAWESAKASQATSATSASSGIKKKKKVEKPAAAV